MLHYKQKTDCTCGAAAYRSIVSQFELISEKEAVDDCKTTKDGTFTGNVLNALKDRIGKYTKEINLINLDISFEDYAHWLLLNSRNRLIYLSCNFIDEGKGGKGRRSHRPHAVACYSGYIYDPSEEKPIRIESFFDICKFLHINDMIIIDI